MLPPSGAGGGVGGGAAAVAVGVLGADVEVQFGDAAHDVIVGAGDRAGHDLAEIARPAGCLVVADQLVVGVFQFHFGDRGVETLDHVDAGLGQGAHRHQGGARRDLAARAVGFGLAGIVGDLADRDAHRTLADKAAHAAQGRGIGGLVGDHRRAADRRGVAADRSPACGLMQPSSAIAASMRTSGLIRCLRPRRVMGGASLFP